MTWSVWVHCASGNAPGSMHVGNMVMIDQHATTLSMHAKLGEGGRLCRGVLCQVGVIRRCGGQLHGEPVQARPAGLGARRARAAAGGLAALRHLGAAHARVAAARARAAWRPGRCRPRWRGAPLHKRLPWTACMQLHTLAPHRAQLASLGINWMSRLPASMGTVVSSERPTPFQVISRVWPVACGAHV